MTESNEYISQGLKERAGGTTSGLLTLDKAGPIQMGFWVPNRVWATAAYLVPLRKYIEEKKKAGTLAPLQPVIQDFKDWVTSDSIYRMWVTSMIGQANGFICTLDKPVRDEIKGDGDTLWIKDYDSFFEILNEIITTSPSFNTTAQVGHPDERLSFCPLRWPLKRVLRCSTTRRSTFGSRRCSTLGMHS